MLGGGHLHFCAMTPAVKCVITYLVHMGGANYHARVWWFITILSLYSNRFKTLDCTHESRYS